jgi:hypothetical protein
MNIKVTLEGRIHTNGQFLKLLQNIFDALTELRTAADLERYNQIREFLQSDQGKPMREVLELSADTAACLDVLVTHDAMDDGDLIADGLTVEGGTTELHKGYVLLDAGPFTIEVDPDDLRRALLPFEV